MGSMFPVPTSSQHNSRPVNLRLNVPECVFKIAEGNPTIWYISGYRSYQWPLLTKTKDGIKGFCGKSGYTSDLSLCKLHLSPTDSIAFFESNKALINWGFDSLTIESVNMKPHYNAQPSPRYENLGVIFSPPGLTFNSEFVVQFSGPDSIYFNNQLNRLMLIMLWLSSPEIRKHIPEKLIIDSPYSFDYGKEEKSRSPGW